MRSKFSVSIIGVIAISIALLSSCASLGSKKQIKKLDQSIAQYSSALRWGRYQETVAFHVTKSGKLAKVNINYLENISVTSVEFISKTIMPNSKTEGSETESVERVMVISEINYFHESEGYLRKLKLNQLWWYNQEIKNWLIETDFPKFK